MLLRIFSLNSQVLGGRRGALGLLKMLPRVVLCKTAGDRHWPASPLPPHAQGPSPSDDAVNQSPAFTRDSAGGWSTVLASALKKLRIQCNVDGKMWTDRNNVYQRPAEFTEESLSFSHWLFIEHLLLAGHWVSGNEQKRWSLSSWSWNISGLRRTHSRLGRTGENSEG